MSTEGITLPTAWDCWLPVIIADSTGIPWLTEERFPALADLWRDDDDLLEALEASV